MRKGVGVAFVGSPQAEALGIRCWVDRAVAAATDAPSAVVLELVSRQHLADLVGRSGLEATG